MKPAVISASFDYTKDSMRCTTLSRRKPGLASPKLQTPRHVSIGQLRYRANISTLDRPAFLPALGATSLKVLLSRASRQSSAASCAASHGHVSVHESTTFSQVAATRNHYHTRSSLLSQSPSKKTDLSTPRHPQADALAGNPPERPRKACVWPVWRWVLAVGRVSSGCEHSVSLGVTGREIS